MITRLHHVHIIIPIGQEEAGRAFYCDLLGLPEVAKPKYVLGCGAFWLQVGNRQIHVEANDTVGNAETRAHIAFEVNDLSFWRRQFKKAGFAFIEKVPYPGYDRIEVRDPFGNLLEFVQLIL